MSASAASSSASKPEPQTMSVRELKEELKAGGVNTAGMLEKDDLVAALKMLRIETSAPAEATCSHCGASKDVSLLKCSRCMHASYCGAECQRAAWKGHKKSCARIEDIYGKLATASAAGDWRGIIMWEGRMEELLEKSPDTVCDLILRTFLQGRMGIISEDGIRENALPCTILQERRVQLLGKMGRFRDQGQLMCELAGLFEFAGEPHQAAKCLNRARDVGAAHGFFSVECRACEGPLPHPPSPLAPPP